VIACHPVQLVFEVMHSSGHVVSSVEKHARACILGQTDGRTPLYTACREGHVAVVEVLGKALVKAGASVNQAAVCDRMPSCAAGRVVSLG
jgi:hypothetical protein